MSKSMLLITSAAYVSEDVVSEVGLLPPSFLPVGNQRLFEYQIDSLSQIGGDIYLSVPDTFDIEYFDKRLIEQKNVKLIYVPCDLSLGDSILYCWNATGVEYSHLSILHGDTLFKDCILEKGDLIGVHKNTGFYKRAVINGKNYILSDIKDEWANDEQMVISGYFSFLTPRLMMKSITEKRGNFTEALRSYSEKQRFASFSRGVWLDFGHLNSYFRSRIEMTTQRAFNELTITPRRVIKSSNDNKKISAEAEWFVNIPRSLSTYVPNFLAYNESVENQRNSYILEYLYLIPLNDLLVYGGLPNKSWEQVFLAINEMFNDFASYQDKSSDHSRYNSMYLRKTMARLKKYSESSGFNLDKKLKSSQSSKKTNSLIEIALKSAEYISPVRRNDIVIYHGDLGFSNILYDGRSRRIKIVDPRGLDFNNNVSIYGDQRYDIAKLYHSIIGLYDFIIAGRYISYFDIEVGIYNISFENIFNYKNIVDVFKKVFLSKVKYTEIEILAINIHLFLSMLPLHYDCEQRQAAMIANALRLYEMLEIKIEQGVKNDCYTNGRVI